VTRTIVLDTGALIAGDRNDPKITAIVKAARDNEANVLVPAGCLSEAWRDGRRQANLSRLLKAVHGVPAIDAEAAKRAGELLFRTARDVGPIDASVVDVCSRYAPCVLVTSDPEDMNLLLAGLPARDVLIFAL
jgi:hypothetical protein